MYRLLSFDNCQIMAYTVSFVSTSSVPHRTPQTFSVRSRLGFLKIYKCFRKWKKFIVRTLFLIKVTIQNINFLIQNTFENLMKVMDFQPRKICVHICLHLYICITFSGCSDLKSNGYPPPSGLLAPISEHLFQRMQYGVIFHKRSYM